MSAGGDAAQRTPVNKARLETFRDDLLAETTIPFSALMP